MGGTVFCRSDARVAPVIRVQAAEFRVQAPVSLEELRQTWQESGNALLTGPGQQLLERALAFLDSPSQQEVSVPQGAALQYGDPGIEGMDWFVTGVVGQLAK